MHNGIHLELMNVSKQFKNHRRKTFSAVKNINLQILEGECVGIVGESGSGKSTLAKIIAHLTPVTSGTIHFKGREITSLKNKDLKEYYKQVQMVFQDPLASFSPRMKIGTYLMEPFVNFKILKKKEAMDYAEELLEMVGLEKQLINRYSHELSGGQLQRVVIARAIGLKPSLVICDEITSALDVTIQHQILQLFMDLRRKTNFSCVFITHDLAVAESVCDKIYVMHEGEIIEEVHSNSLMRDAKHPYTMKLLQSALSLQPSM